MILCSKCAAQNDNNAKFCSVCGEPLRRTVIPVYTDQSQSRRSAVLGMVSALFSLISVAAIGVILIYNCIQFNTLLQEVGFGAYSVIAWLRAFDRYISWGLISIVTAFCVIFSRKDSKSIPLVKGIDALVGLITFVLYGTESVGIWELLFCVVGGAAAVIWGAAPKKSWIASILILAESGFLVLRRYALFSTAMNVLEVLRLVGMLCLGIGMALKGFQPTSDSKIKQIDTKAFWIIIAALQIISVIVWI